MTHGVRTDDRRGWLTPSLLLTTMSHTLALYEMYVAYSCTRAYPSP